MPTVIPTIRMYDLEKTAEFYIEWLGFKIDWQHEFEPGSSPIFMQLSLRDIRLYLSGHHGDGSPGIHITIDGFEGLRAYHRQLNDKKYKYGRPGLTVPEWAADSISMTVIDPVGNHITFTGAAG